MRMLNFLIITAVLQGCSVPKQDGRGSERTVAVELLAFSGRENPHWELTDTEVDELIRRVSDLTPGAPPPEPPGLGYGGFLITTSGNTAELPEMMRVYRGIRIGPAGSSNARQDRGLERWLLDIARQRGYGDLLDALGL